MDKRARRADGVEALAFDRRLSAGAGPHRVHYFVLALAGANFSLGD
ncbi:hypothetical protein WOA01_12270 [Methylocystis sp. IM2]